MNISDLNEKNDQLKESFCSLEKLYEGYKDSELSEELVLPDYLGDIKRIISYDAAPSIKGSYLNGEEIEYDGDVIYTVMYLTAENMLRSVIFSEDFESSVRIDGYAEDATVELEPEVQNLTLRVTGPRKIAMKGKVRTDIRVMKKLCMEPEVNGKQSIEDEINLERRISEERSAKIQSGFDSDIKFSEEFELGASEKSIEDIIYCNVSLNLSDCKALKDKAAFKGNALFKCLYTTVSETGEEGYASITRSFPIANLSDFTNCSEECTCIAKAIPDKVKAEVIKDEADEGRGIKLDFTYDIAMICSANEPIIVTEDIFSTEYECDCEYKEREITRFVKAVNTGFSVNLSKSREELNAGDAKELLFADAKVQKSKISVEAGGKPVYSGEAAVTVLYNTENGESGGCSFTAPVRLVLDGIETSDSYDCKVYATVTNCSARSDKNDIYADIELSVLGIIYAKEKRRSVMTVNMYKDKKLAAAKYPITLCYPERGESLWEVAKRYHVSLSALSAVNGISDTEVLTSKLLVIPRSSEGAGYSTII